VWTNFPEINTYLCHQTEAGFEPLNPAGARQSYAPYQLPLEQLRCKSDFRYLCRRSQSAHIV